MQRLKLTDLDILDVGNTIQLAGAIYSGDGKTFLIPLPDEDSSEILRIGRLSVLVMTAEEMERFLNQTDVLAVRSSVGGKAILRKSQRQIDNAVSWKVFRRDGFACRYCGRDDVPLTVDHVDTWEDGGATVAENLVSACRQCNKTRGNDSYADWLASPAYSGISKNLSVAQLEENQTLLKQMSRLLSLRIKKRSR